MNANVYSLYWKNVSPEIINSQKILFKKLGIPLEQQCMNGLDHGVWMTQVLAAAGDDDVVVFCDIDAFPLSKNAYNNAVEFAKSGGVFGLAQFSAHTPSLNLYAGPMFLAVSRSTWVALGTPSLKASRNVDAGEYLTICASESCVPINLVMPTSCVKPKWALGNKGVFGIGTFYGDLEYFHLFESRRSSSLKLFRQVVSDVMSNNPLNFNEYLKIFKRNTSINQIRNGISAKLSQISILK